MSLKYETLLYRQRQAHRAWLDRAALKGKPQSDDMAELVWELMLDYCEASRDFESARDDVYKTALDIAMSASAKLPKDEVYSLYRDALLDAILQFVSEQVSENPKTIVDFACEVSNAFNDAYLNLMKKTMRVQRAESTSYELHLAKSIQSQLMPISVPEVRGFEFAGRLVPAHEIGGDYWSIKHQYKDGIITLKLADITGHGIAAATLVAAVKFISGGYYAGSTSAAEVMNKTNGVLSRETPHEIMVSMVYGWLRPATHEITFVNAGLEPVFVCGNGRCLDIAPTGAVLGLSENSDYQETSMVLHKGDVVFCGSDGITEAGIGEMFGMDRLKELVVANSHLTAGELADKVVNTVIEYAHHPADDISLVVAKVTEDPLGS